MATSDEIKRKALELSEKTDSNSISPKEVGGIMHDLASLGENAIRNGGTLGIRKVYTSVSVMEADKNPKDFWGNPMKKGNLVLIYDGTTTGLDNNKIYVYMNPGWEFATYLDAGYPTRQEFSELGSDLKLKTFMLFGEDGHEDENYIWENPTNGYETLNGYYLVDGTFVQSSNHKNARLSVSYGQILRISFDYQNYEKDVSMLSFWEGDKFIDSVLNANIYKSYKKTIIVSVPQNVDSIVYFFGNTSVEIGRNKAISEIDRLDSKLSQMALDLEHEKLKSNFEKFTSDNLYEQNQFNWVTPSNDIVESVSGIYYDDGTFVESNHRTDLINVKEGNIVKLNISYTNYSKGVAVISLWNNEELVSVPLSARLYSDYKGTIVSTIPNGVNKIGIIVSAVSISIANKESSNTSYLVASLQIQSGNLVSHSQIYETLGIDNTGRVIKENWSLCVIKVKPNSTYYIKAKAYRLNSVGALGFSDTDDVAVDRTLEFVDMSTLKDYQDYKEFTTDEDTNYVFVNLKPLLTDNEVIVKENTEDKDFPTTVGERKIFEHLKNKEEEGFFVFKDKKIALFGDSITHQAIGGNPERGWAKYFNEILNFGELVNYARSGATWSNTENTIYNITENTGSLSNDNVIYNQFNRLLNDISNGAKAPDYIIIAAGTNDAWYPQHRPNALIKTAKEVFEDESTKYLESVNINQCTSIAQSFRYVAEMIIANLPTTKVVICTPLQSTAFTAERNKDVTDVISSCANYMGWNIIVQSKECGVSRLQEKRGYQNTYDGTHTSEAGAKMIGEYIANKFSSIFSKHL